MDKVKEILSDLIEQHFPKGECKERGTAIVLGAMLLIKFEAYHKQEVERILDGLMLKEINIPTKLISREAEQINADTRAFNKRIQEARENYG